MSVVLWRFILQGDHFQWCQLQQRCEVTSYSCMKTLLCHHWVWETFEHDQSFVCPSDNFTTQWLFKNILEHPSEIFSESLLPVFVRQMTSLQSSWPPQDASNSSSYEKSSPWIFTCIKPILWILEKCDVWLHIGKHWSFHATQTGQFHTCLYILINHPVLRRKRLL